MQDFNFDTAFASADFIICGHGDGRGTDHIHGWEALVERVKEDCGADLTILDDEWEWSDEKVSQPYFMNLSFEAEGLTIVRLGVQAVQSIRATPSARGTEGG